MNLTLHQRIRRDLEGQILGGHWRPGERIPSEHALMAQYGCSRMTVNKVLSALATSGLIERRRRAGSFVARPSPHLEQAALDIPDIAAAVSARGHAYALKLLDRQHQPRCETPSVPDLPAPGRPTPTGPGTPPDSP